MGCICVTTYYVNAEIWLKKFIISFKQITYPHYTLCCARWTYLFLIEWDLIDKTFNLTLDNANVNDRAATDLHNTLGAEMFFKAEYCHVRCNAHIQYGTRLITSTIANVRDIVNTITSILPRMQIFNSVVQRTDLTTKVVLRSRDVKFWRVTLDIRTHIWSTKRSLITKQIT